MGLRAKAMATLVLSSSLLLWVAAIARGRKGLCRFSWVDIPENPAKSSVSTVLAILLSASLGILVITFMKRVLVNELK
jgi:hypothetical protein